MIEVNNLTHGKIDKMILKKIVKFVLETEKKDLDVSIALIGQEDIKKLNRKYRGKNKPTDVLSFLYAEHSGPYDNKSGEVVLCPREIEKGELFRVLIHGVLHLLGHDHEKNKKVAEVMKKKEDYYLQTYDGNF